MPLPFLLKKKEFTNVVETRKPDENKEETDKDQALRAAAQDLISAIHDRNESAAASALRAAFQIVDSEPHEEGPHTEEEDDQG